MKTVVFALALAGLVLLFAQFAPRQAWAQESQLDSLRAAAKSSATDAAAALAFGRALRRAAHFTEALAELRRGTVFAASKPDVAIQLSWEIARVQMDRHDFRQALAACGVLGALRGASAEGHACAADAHLVWQRATEALTETAAALAKDPECYEAKIAEGRAHEFALDAAKSDAAFRVAIGWHPERVDAHVGLGRVLLKNGKKEEALAELRKAVQLDPNGPDASRSSDARAPLIRRCVAGAGCARAFERACRRGEEGGRGGRAK
jgi:tetratricopeptide (TPR) repeat protein